MSGTMRLPETPTNIAAALRESAGLIIGLLEKQDKIKDDLSEAWAAAKELGIDVKALRLVVGEMRDREKLEGHIAFEILVDKYRQTLKLVGDGVDPERAKLEAIAASLAARGIDVRLGVD